ncbi:hypothetical protein K435DRAFT_869316 [Dendrothele bispora CBS 962.96]|uniref:Uncharacterized protein n=1 Tax=Dendrothele bispora (strain CBS 962.96) TaxID=1314807 RepID=A0A4S8L9X9_DENBC|nr:hypothetical protein K435DRAFT_869316 [Dendrothele bispora CBS 962.96]
MKEKKQTSIAKGRSLRSNRLPTSSVDLPPLTRTLRPLNEHRTAYATTHTNPQRQKDSQEQLLDDGDQGIESNRETLERFRSERNNDRVLARESAHHETPLLVETGDSGESHESTRSLSYQYLEEDEHKVTHIVEGFRLVRTPDPTVYAVGSTLFSTLEGSLTACRVGRVSERIDRLSIKILVKYLTPYEVWVLVGTLGADKPFAKFLAKDVSYDQDWQEFCVNATFVRLELGEQVERCTRFRIVVPPTDRPALLDAIEFQCQPREVEWERDWEYTYNEFKDLDSLHFLFDHD